MFGRWDNSIVLTLTNLADIPIGGEKAITPSGPTAGIVDNPALAPVVNDPKTCGAIQVLDTT